jgi:NAD(P)-dependent dehydrogenase (short-subunit alcohol dehydrogenase family)
LEKYGRIDILVSNAATNPIFGDIMSVRFMKHWPKSVVVYWCRNAKDVVQEGGTVDHFHAPENNPFYFLL